MDNEQHGEPDSEGGRQKRLANEGEKVKRTLQSAPRIKAAPDFEERLFRRIEAERNETRKPSFLGSLFTAWRVPSIAYSIATLVILGVVVYTAFFRSGSLPTQEMISGERQESPVNKPIANGQPPSAVSPSSAIPSTSQAQKDDGMKESGEIQRAKAPLSSGTPQSQSVQPGRQDGMNELKKAQADGGRQAGNAQQQAEGVSAVRMQNAEESAAQAVQLSTKEKTDSAVRSIQNLSPGQTYTPHATMESRKVEPYLYRTVSAQEMYYDSLRRLDSLRADSIKRARLDSLMKLNH